MDYSILKKIYEKKGYVFFDKGNYNLNIFGVRALDTTPDLFNDTIGVGYRDDKGQEIVKLFKGTTDPGSYYLNEKMGNPEGTAILIPDQYRGCFMKGYHIKKYKALIQKPGYSQFKVWRDDDKDGKLDFNGEIHFDVTGLNLHTTSFIRKVDRIGPYSAGCQVLESSHDMGFLMRLVDRAIPLYGNSFTYTLFEQLDFY